MVSGAGFDGFTNGDDGLMLSRARGKLLESLSRAHKTSDSLTQALSSISFTCHMYNLVNFQDIGSKYIAQKLSLL